MLFVVQRAYAVQMGRSESGSIVVAVDGSEHADRALRWAADQASFEHRHLLAVTVGEDAETVAEKAVVEATRLHPGISVQALTTPGDPRQVLIDLSSRAHLLVVGSRGRGALKTMLLGSVSAAVSAHATCPVVICRPDGHPAGRGVMVGADGTPGSLPVIDFAYRQAALRELPLTVLHCFWDAAAAVAQYHQARGEVVDPPEFVDLEVLLAESVAGLAETYPDVDVTLSLRHGLVDEALSRRDGEWDLIVVGRHPMASLDRVITGSIATTVVERAHTTVAVVPETSPSS